MLFDNENKHSKYLCSKCYRKLTYFKSQTSVSEKTLNEAVMLAQSTKTFGVNKVTLLEMSALAAHILTIIKVTITLTVVTTSPSCSFLKGRLSQVPHSRTT